MSSAEPLKPVQVRHWIARYLSEYESHTPKIPAINPGWIGLLRGKLNDVLPDNVDRYYVLGWIFSRWGEETKPMSSKDLTDAQWFALRRWMGSSDTSGHWSIRETWAQEALWVAWERAKPREDEKTVRDPAERHGMDGNAASASEMPVDNNNIMVNELIKLGGRIVEIGPPEAIPAQPVRRVCKIPEVFKFD